MPTSLTVPMDFRLPESWFAARLEGRDPGAAFAAVHPERDAPFVADITVTGGIPRRRAVIRSALTATAAQHDAVPGESREFLWSVRADSGRVA